MSSSPKPKNKTPVASCSRSAHDLLSALGLEKRMVTALEIKAVPQGLVEVHCEFHLSVEDVDNLTTAFEKYTLVPITK